MDYDPLSRDGTRVGTGTGKPGFEHKIWNPGFKNQNPRTRVLEFFNKFRYSKVNMAKVRVLFSIDQLII